MPLDDVANAGIPQTFPDGLTNTIMIGESVARQQGWIKGKQRYNDGASWGQRGAWAQGSNNIVCAGTVNPVSATAPAKVKAAAEAPTGIAINAWNQGELYSFHTGVCNVAMGDGSVRFLTDSAPAGALAAMSTRAGGEVNPDW